MQRTLPLLISNLAVMEMETLHIVIPLQQYVPLNCNCDASLHIICILPRCGAFCRIVILANLTNNQSVLEIPLNKAYLHLKYLLPN